MRRKNPVTPATKPAHTPALKALKGEKADATHPGNLRVPKSALFNRRDAVTEDGKPVTLAEGNKPMTIIDQRNNQPVQVSLIEGVSLTPGTDGRLIFVETGMTHDLLSIGAAKSHFVVQKNGTVVYCQQGPQPGADDDMLDIVALIEHNNSAAGVAVDKKLAADTQKVSDDQAAENKAAADKAARDNVAADKAAAKAAKN